PGPAMGRGPSSIRDRAGAWEERRLGTGGGRGPRLLQGGAHAVFPAGATRLPAARAVERRAASPDGDRCCRRRSSGGIARVLAGRADAVYVIADVGPRVVAAMVEHEAARRQERLDERPRPVLFAVA